MTRKTLTRYKGKLAGKIVIFGAMRPVPPVEKPLWVRLDDAELKKLTEYPLETARSALSAGIHEAAGAAPKNGKFFADEHVLAVITPSRDGRDGGGSGGTIFDDSNAGFGWEVYKRETANPVPVVVMAIENYGRMYRLLKAQRAGDGGDECRHQVHRRPRAWL